MSHLCFRHPGRSTMALARNMNRIERNIDFLFLFFSFFFLFCFSFFCFFVFLISFFGPRTQHRSKSKRNIESIESKFATIFKRPKNREDGSDFDDFWSESIVSTQSIFSQNVRTNKKIIESMESMNWIGQSIDGRLDK